jgi:hypothetical protein
VIRVLPLSFQPAFEIRYPREPPNEEAAVALDMSTPAIKTPVLRAPRLPREHLARPYGLTRSE